MPLWSSPPSPIVLCADEVHLWRSRLDLAPEHLTTLYNTLSEDEQLRAKRFRFERDRNAFIAGRGQLRTILAHYLNLEPAAILFSYSPKGKPSLNPAHGSSQLEFNLSHSNTLALYSITRNHRIGIDLEFLRPLPNANQLAQRFFTTQEHTTLTTLPPEHQQIAFFNGWTRKEAYLKATGEGIGGLQHIEVSLAPNEPPRLLHLPQSPTPNNWTLYDLAPHPNYIGALAVEAQNLHLCYFEA